MQWDGSSSEELSEALFAETALFGEISNHSCHNISSLPNLQHHPEQNVDPKAQCLSTSMSQLLNDSRLLKQQQVWILACDGCVIKVYDMMHHLS